jgi:hypothetical protein
MSEIMTWADMHRIWATIDAERQAHAETQRLLEDLTPGGSEFAGDPKRCAQFVRERLATNIEFVKAARLAERERDEARREVERLSRQTETLRAAIKHFRENAGRHPGLDHVTADYKPCRRCEESYMHEEEVLDSALEPRTRQEADHA